MVSNEKREELKDAIIDVLMGDVRRNFLTISEELVSKVIEMGWQWHPPKDDYPDPTAMQVDDIMTRIIHGLPMVPLVVPHESHEGIADVVLYDVVTLHPGGVDLWKRIPEFDNYEANPFGVVRNRWTRRVLDVAKIGDQESVEMHDKDGFPHELNIRYIIEKTFDN